MKIKFLAILTLILFYCSFIGRVNAQALPGKNLVKFGIGAYSTERIIATRDDVNNGVNAIFTLGNRNFVKRRNYTPTYTFGYKHAFTKGFSLGFSLATESSRAFYDNRNNIECYFDRSVFTITPEASITYLNKPIVKLYASIGLGMAFVSVKGNIPSNMQVTTADYFNSYISPFGIRIGKTFGITAEVGYGYKGFAHLGIDFQF